MFDTAIAGSLPKPSWLAEPNRLWAPWRLAPMRRGVAYAKLSALAAGAALARERFGG